LTFTLSEKLKMYFVTGLIPEAVRAWIKARDTEPMQQVLSNILDAYERDFAKHAEPKEFPKLSLIWRSIPSQLARKNKIKSHERAHEPGNMRMLCKGFATRISHIKSIAEQRRDYLSPFMTTCPHLSYIW
jgi:hypothetical protein